MTSFARRTACLSLTLAIAMTVSFLGGCSIDRHNFESTIDRPTTVTLTEYGTRQVVWSMDIPVNHRLVIDFDRSGEMELVKVSGQPATRMHWKLFPIGKTEFVDEFPIRTSVESDTVELSGLPVVMNVSYRPAPEFPEGMAPAREVETIPAAPAVEVEDADHEDAAE